MSKKSTVVFFVVLTEPGAKGDASKVFYYGPDKAKARQVAGRVLMEGETEVAAWRVTQRTRLTQDDLTASLGRGAF